MANPKRRPAAGRDWKTVLLPVLLCALTLAVLLPLAGRGDLFNETEGQYAAAAVAITEGGSWLIPENSGVPRLSKPPLLVWMVAVGFHAGDISEFTARLPGVIGMTVLVLATYLVGARLGGPWRGFMAGAILLGCFGSFTLGRILMPEPWFCAFLALAVYGGMRSLEDPRGSGAWALVFWTAAALAAFVKAWHGLVIPLLILTLAAVLAGRCRALRRVAFFAPGWGVAALINLPWLLAVEARFPGFVRYFFIDEGLGHALGTDTPATAYQAVPRREFVLLHLAWFFPWVVAAVASLPGALAQAARSPNLRPGKMPVDVAIPIAWGLVVVVLVLAVGQRQDYYGMMGWPVFALYLAAAWGAGGLRAASVVLAVFGIAGLAAVFAFPLWKAGLPAEMGTLAARATALSTVTGVDAGFWQGLLVPLAAVSLGLVLAGAAAFWCLRHGWPGRAFSCWLAGALALGVFAAGGMAQVSPWFSHREVAAWLQRRGGVEAIYDGGADTGSSLHFYLRRPIRVVAEFPKMDFAAREHGAGAGGYLNFDQIAAKWEQGDNFFLITEVSEAPVWAIRLPGIVEHFRAQNHAVLGRPRWPR